MRRCDYESSVGRYKMENQMRPCKPLSRHCLHGAEKTPFFSSCSGNLLNTRPKLELAKVHFVAHVNTCCRRACGGIEKKNIINTHLSGTHTIPRKGFANSFHNFFEEHQRNSAKCNLLWDYKYSLFFIGTLFGSKKESESLESFVC